MPAAGGTMLTVDRWHPLYLLPVKAANTVHRAPC